MFRYLIIPYGTNAHTLETKEELPENVLLKLDRFARIFKVGESGRFLQWIDGVWVTLPFEQN